MTPGTTHAQPIRRIAYFSMEFASAQALKTYSGGLGFLGGSWAGKPYPFDYASIGIFDRLVYVARHYVNCSVMVGYEMHLSKLLKQGADL